MVPSTGGLSPTQIATSPTNIAGTWIDSDRATVQIWQIEDDVFRFSTQDPDTKVWWQGTIHVAGRQFSSEFNTGNFAGRGSGTISSDGSVMRGIFQNPDGRAYKLTLRRK
jgi:hypothetical protein